MSEDIKATGHRLTRDVSAGGSDASTAPLPRVGAREILESLESGDTASVGLPQQMYLFGPAASSAPSPIEEELEHIDPDALSPREAHDLIYHLKHLVNKPRKHKG